MPEEDQIIGRLKTSKISDSISALERYLIEEAGSFFFVVSSPVAMKIFSPDGEIVFINSACLELFGIEAIKDIEKISLFDDANITQENKLDLQQSESIKYESIVEFGMIKSLHLYNTYKTGALWIETTIVPITSSYKIIGYMVCIQDISKQKQKELELLDKEAVFSRMLAVSSVMININSKEVNYTTLTDAILDISGAKYATFNLFDDNGLDFTSVAISGFSENIMKVSSILGYDLINKKWKHDPVRDDKIKDKIITQFDNLSEMTGDVIPKPVLSIIEKSFDVGSISIVRISREDKSIGDFTLIFPRGSFITNNQIVELFAEQVGLFIYRNQTENSLAEKSVALESKINELEKLNSLMIGRENKMAELKLEIAHLKSLIGGKE